MRNINLADLRLSTHVRQRMQQRGVTGEILETLLQFGKRTRSRKGFSYAMDKHGRERARRELGESTFRRIADRLDSYVILSVDETTVITVAHILKHKPAT